MTAPVDRPALVLLCPSCQGRMTRLDADTIEQSDRGPRVEFYRCDRDRCPTTAKLAVLFELAADHAPAEAGFVAREIARRGAFFPSDYFQGSGPRGRFG